MSSLYYRAAQMLTDWAGEDAGLQSDPRKVSKEIVDMIIGELKEKGMAALDLAAAHDGPRQE
jgi:hypothetical protein